MENQSSEKKPQQAKQSTEITKDKDGLCPAHQPYYDVILADEVYVEAEKIFLMVK